MLDIKTVVITKLGNTILLMINICMHSFKHYSYYSVNFIKYINLTLIRTEQYTNRSLGLTVGFVLRLFSTSSADRK